MKKLCSDKSSITLSSNQTRFQSVWASIATSFNYVSPAHCDEDSFLSCLMVSYFPSNHPEKTFAYKVDMPIALYFCIPEYSIAVA